MSTTLQRPGFTVDPWDPGYAAAVAVEALAELEGSSAELDLEVEVPAPEWRPITPPVGTAPPKVLLIADGVRRIDARVWVHGGPEEMPVAGIAASYAAGIVRCVPGGDTPAALAAVEVRRSLFSSAPSAPEAVTPLAVYQAEQSGDGGLDDLSLALQRRLTELEVTLAINYRAESGEDDLLLVDGPLRGRTHLPSTVGYVKTHHTSYLPKPQAAVVPALVRGQRTPVFRMGTSWQRHAWYVKLPVRSQTPWAGIARCEAGADLSVPEVVALANAITLVLPSMAGVDYKDPRAPQNLVPIGGLEKLLRHRLGDPGLLYRALRSAATSS
ncbi:hypothetical protein Acor_53200 [Acrocarpospora corrugata]|uniref:Nuclease n=1 Tax=Acrocarpospora corrugata TaxID=35763 RepID=A0A5M3W3B1_9ACTN|nr:hypothetical protein [Acrocarpospora corrugata]GES03254.1 hypothetical protein Acor_53200 [Acrocarpospora corrugata]